MVERASNRILDRIRDIGEGEDPVDWLTELFREGLPLDKARADEADVWNAFMELSRTESALDQARQVEWLASQHLCRTAVANLAGIVVETSADAPLDEPLETEASLLHAVWDGLVTLLSAYPESDREALADRLLRLHLTGIRDRAVSRKAMPT